jgi:hypothetical protein
LISIRLRCSVVCADISITAIWSVAALAVSSIPLAWLRHGYSSTALQPATSYNWFTCNARSVQPTNQGVNQAMTMNSTCHCEPDCHRVPETTAHQRSPDQGVADPSRRSARCAAIMMGALAATAALVTGCSHSSPSPGVASISAPTSGGSSSAGAKTSALAYSQCMRVHGIKDFPDPNSNGDIALNAQPGSDIDPNNPKYVTADNACKSLMPAQTAPPADLKVKTLKYAKCMRANGVSDFPDPKADGTLQVRAEPGSDLDPNNPVFKKADTTCKQYLPDGGAGEGNSNGGGS